jgi:hypothetical protein
MMRYRLHLRHQPGPRDVLAALCLAFMLAVALCFTAQSCRGQILAWDPVPEADLAGYRVRLSESTTAGESWHWTGPAAFLHLPWVQPGRFYTATVFAESTTGAVSDPSQPLVFRWPPVTPPPPGVPQLAATESLLTFQTAPTPAGPWVALQSFAVPSYYLSAFYRVEITRP